MPGIRLRPQDGGSPIQLGGDPVSIGRHPSNTIPISDERASRKHCVIEPDGTGGYRLRDLGSRNGTKLNGIAVQEAPVSAGDVVSIGHAAFVIEMSPGASTHERTPSRDTPTTHPTSGPSPGAEPDWAGDLTRVLSGLPPRDEPPPVVNLLGADGNASAALDAPGDGPRAVLLLLQTASKARATDIHLEPKAELALVRMRVDGQMVWVADIPRRVGELVVGLIRAVCQMKAAASDAVLDGHFSSRFPDRRVEYRVSITPTVHGPKLVARILDDREIPRSIADLGLAPYMEERVRRACAQDHGMLLACGPTGSGKTTTLYNCLRAVDRDRRNVITIEDPVEYQIEGCTQIPINEKRGNTFSSLLRSVLRQDPDVILLGEIRDEETARTAMQAAITGHLVFSTLHAKDSISAVFRLMDLKIESYLVANALDLVLAQRLVRVLCDNCRREVPVSPGQATRVGRFLAGKSSVYSPVGCQACLKTGFRGRRALFELLDVNDELRDVILGEPTILAIRRVIEQGLFATLQQSGWRLAAEGQTCLEEVDRVAGG